MSILSEYMYSGFLMLAIYMIYVSIFFTLIWLPSVFKGQLLYTVCGFVMLLFGVFSPHTCSNKSPRYHHSFLLSLSFVGCGPLITFTDSLYFKFTILLFVFFFVSYIFGSPFLFFLPFVIHLIFSWHFKFLLLIFFSDTSLYVLVIAQEIKYTLLIY